MFFHGKSIIYRCFSMENPSFTDVFSMDNPSFIEVFPWKIHHL
jgi:hypothetical protein